MSEHLDMMRNLTKEKDFFVGIDSDGCAFDTMEIKQKECFIPNTCLHWGLQAVSSLARETAEFVNLHSRWRGTNRFPALVKVFDLLAERPEAIERGYRTPEIPALRHWVGHEAALGNATLKKELDRTGAPDLKRTLDWSLAINKAIAKLVHGVPAFQHVRESLQRLVEVADVMCVSATPQEALRREWDEHGLAKYARIIAGQEMGSKREHLQHAAVGKYDPDKILMVGDALGDKQAAADNGVMFYPINPGREADSWKRFLDEGIGRFLAGKFRGAYEDKLFKEFMRYLPDVPPWKIGTGTIFPSHRGKPTGEFDLATSGNEPYAEEEK
ncbi:MAG: HAD family hydrolase [Phycisphaerae bacterium]